MLTPVFRAEAEYKSALRTLKTLSFETVITPRCGTPEPFSGVFGLEPGDRLL
jgi:hypothetical protein